MIKAYQVQVKGYDTALERRIVTPTGKWKVLKNKQQMERLNKELRKPWERFYLTWVRESDLGKFSIRN